MNPDNHGPLTNIQTKVGLSQGMPGAQIDHADIALEEA